jgi:hypothetical protein
MEYAMSRTNLTTLLVAMAFVAGITIGSVGLWTQVVRGSPYSSPSAFELGPVPVGMNFQGEVTDLSGTGLNGKYNMRFAIFDSLTGGTNAWPGAVASFEQHDSPHCVRLASGTVRPDVGL